MSEALSKPSRVWMYLGIGLVIFWILCLAVFLPARRNAFDNTGMSTPASYDWSPVDLNDQPVPFSRFKGKTVFLNFWATWCGPCVREMPSIEKLARNPRLQDKNIAFVCVSSDASTDTVRQFVAGKDWPMTILRTDRVPSVFYSTAIPATFIIAPDGRIATFVEGADDWSVPEAVEFLEKLSKPDSPASAK
jgi:thiol-disulfide isomerase/thioredoxin